MTHASTSLTQPCGGIGALVLLADSQWLFRRESILHAWLRNRLTGRNGIYIGAANGDDPQFFSLAQAACEGMGAQLAMHTRTSALPACSADFCILAGGEVADGWAFISEPPVRNMLARMRDNGATFVGISAGAMHLAGVLAEDRVVPLLDWLHAAVAVHEESAAWPTRQQWCALPEPKPPLACIPFGGALVVEMCRIFQAGKGALLLTSRDVAVPLPWLGGTVS